MDATAITTALQGVVTDIEAMITAGAPIILGVIASMAGLTVGIKLFKKFTSKAA